MDRLLLILALLSAAPAVLGQPAPSLGTAENFVILADRGVTSTGPTRVTGKVGVSSGVVSGFPPGILGFGSEAIETDERTVRRAQQDNAAAQDALFARQASVVILSGAVPSKINAGVVYRFDGDAHVSGDVTFAGPRDGVWILQIRGKLIVDACASTLLDGDALSSHIFWVIGDAVSLGANSAVAGNLLARNDIVFGHGVTLAGRALSQHGAVTLDADAVNLCGKLVVLSPCTISPGTVGEQSTPITAAGGDEPYKLDLVGGALPPGMPIDGGTLAAAGHYAFGVTAIDAKGAVGIRFYTLDVCPKLALPPVLPPGNVCDPYQAPFAATGASDSPTYTFTPLPPGLHEPTPQNPFITGTPTKAGDFPVKACVTDTPSGCTVCAEYTLSIGCNVKIKTSLPKGTECQPYSGSVSPSCPGSYVVSVDCTKIPPGIACPSPSGVFSGPPTSSGPYTFTVRIDHESGCSVTETHTIEISPAAPLPKKELFATVCIPFKEDLGGTITGPLPKGLHGALEGVPREFGCFRITATNPNACPHQQEYKLTISCPKTILLPTPTLPDKLPFYKPVDFAIVDPTLTSCFTYSVKKATLPHNTWFDPASGHLWGLPDELGVSNIEVTATDSESGCTVTQIYVLEIVDPPLLCEPLIVASPLFGSLSDGTVGAVYPAQVFTAAGGIPPYTYDVVIATLPPGLSLSPSGVLSGTPSAAGRFIFAVSATDSTGTPGCPQVYSIDIGN